MNKHLKCFLKVLGIPFVFLVMVIGVLILAPTILIQVPLVLSGCMDDFCDLLGIEDRAIRFLEWYRTL